MTTEGTTEKLIKEHKYMNIRMSFILLTLVFCLTLVGFVWLLKETHDLAEETARLGVANRTLILENERQDKTDITNAIYLCRQNLEGVRRIFIPFFPKGKLTAQENDRISQFNRRINKLKDGCFEELLKR